MVDRSELHHTAGNVRETYFNLPAWQPGVAMGTKIVTVFPANPDKGPLPAVQAVYALFDGKDGRPLLMIDGTALTYRKQRRIQPSGRSSCHAPMLKSC